MKEIRTTYIKTWFQAKLQADERYYHLHLRGPQEIRQETEKAYRLCVEYVTIDGERDGHKAVWVPKACTLTKEEYEAEEAAARERFEAGARRYEKLLAYAKEHGVKVRKGMKTATIKAKLTDAGIEIPQIA